MLAIQIVQIQSKCVFDTDIDPKKCLDPVSTDTVSRYSTALVVRVHSRKENPFPAFSDKQADWTITDSFLDRAMDTHMSEEDCAEAESNKPREEKDGEQRDEHTALPPMPKRLRCISSDSAKSRNRT